jgi:hypothetical protein
MGKMKMLKKSLIIIPIAIFTFYMLWILWGLLSDDRKEIETTVADEEYYYTTDSLIDDIGRKDSTDKFVIYDSESSNLKDSNSEITWEQNEFLLVGNAFLGEKYNESLTNWELKYESYQASCNETMDGYESGSFLFYKYTDEDNEKTRVEMILNIVPGENSLKFLMFNYKPALSIIHAIDPNDILISPDMALQIAEYNGGEIFRKEVNNNCHIRLELNANSHYDGWLISYEGSIGTTGRYLNMEIDSKTGDVIILE